MMNTRLFRIVAVGILFAFLALLWGEAVARRGGGRGGGFSRVGPASGGSFSSRSRAASQRSRTDRTAARTDVRQDRQSNRTDRASDRQEGLTERTSDRQDYITDRQENRQDSISERQDDRLDYREDAREDWQDYYDDHHHWDHWRGGSGFAAGVAVGTVISASSFSSLSCSKTVVVGGSTYYHCGSSWYKRAYSGGSVTYVIVNPPPGY